MPADIAAARAMDSDLSGSAFPPVQGTSRSGIKSRNFFRGFQRANAVFERNFPPKWRVLFASAHRVEGPFR